MQVPAKWVATSTNSAASFATNIPTWGRVCTEERNKQVMGWMNNWKLVSSKMIIIQMIKIDCYHSCSLLVFVGKKADFTYRSERPPKYLQRRKLLDLHKSRVLTHSLTQLCWTGEKSCYFTIIHPPLSSNWGDTDREMDRYKYIRIRMVRLANLLL